jgi:hypothetical protein
MYNNGTQNNYLIIRMVPSVTQFDTEKLKMEKQRITDLYPKLAQ